MNIDITQKFRSLFGDWLNPNVQKINLYFIEAELEGLLISEIVLEFGDELTLPITDLKHIHNDSRSLFFEDASNVNEVEEKLAQLDKMELAISLFKTFSAADYKGTEFESNFKLFFTSSAIEEIEGHLRELK
jgi:hypothetical protein